MILTRLRCALIATALAPALLMAPSAMAAKSTPDLPDIHRTISLAASGDWSGTVSFGQQITGASRSLRPMPVQLDLTRSGCDIAGCLTTRIVLAEADGVPSSVRIASGLSSAALLPTVVGVVVRRYIGNLMIAEHPATMRISVTAKRSGPVIRRTTLVQGPSGEVLTVARLAPIRATITLGDDTMTGVGELARTQIVN